MKKNHNILLVTAILTVALCACTSTKHDLTMFEDLQQSQSGTLATLAHSTKIEPESELIITVNSEVPQATAEYNLPYTNPATPGSTELKSTNQLQTYIVDERGDIVFPKLGTIHVAGMTQMELRDYLTQRIGQTVKDPIVTVQLGGYQVSVIGEVNAPQTIGTKAERFSILDAISHCGGLSDYGRRDDVLVMRRTADNQIEYGHLNLQSSSVTQSPYFWLKHNDVVIVSPNGIKQDNSKYNQNNGYKLSVISTVVSAASVVASLIIALAIK